MIEIDINEVEGCWLDGAVPRGDAEKVERLINLWTNCYYEEHIRDEFHPAATFAREYLTGGDYSEKITPDAWIGMFTEDAYCEQSATDGGPEYVAYTLDRLVEAIQKDCAQSTVAMWHPEEPGTFIVISYKTYEREFGGE